jgi:hypothetical protein
LEAPHLHFNTNPSLKSIERKGVSFQEVGSFIKMDASVFVKSDHRHVLALRNAFVFICLADGKNHIANHLRSQPRGSPKWSIANVMEGNSIPTAMLDCKRDCLVTRAQKLISQRLELIRLIFGQLKFYANRPFHRAKNCINRLFYLQPTEERQFLPAMNDWVSLPSLR